jgi:hypothetical protein
MQDALIIKKMDINNEKCTKVKNTRELCVLSEKKFRQNVKKCCSCSFRIPHPIQTLQGFTFMEKCMCHQFAKSL